MSDVNSRILRACAGSDSGDRNVVTASAYRTVSEMLRDRGYVVHGACSSSDDILLRMTQKQHIVRGTREGAPPIHVYFDTDDKVSIRFVRSLREAHVSLRLLD